MIKKIVFLMPNFDVIGAQKMCLNVIENLDNKDYLPTLIVLDEFGLLKKDSLKFNNHLVLKSNSKGGLISKIQTILSSFKLANFINNLKPDVVVSIAPGTNIILLVSAFFYNFKRPRIIIEEHQHLSTSFEMDKSSHSFYMSIFYKYFLKIYNKANCLKVVSQSSKEDFIKNWGIKKDKVKVINPPINTNRLIERSSHPVPYKIKNFINQSKYIFSLGRIESQKGFDLLLDSFLLVSKTEPNLKLIICGDGSLIKTFTQKIIDNKLEDKILFTGYLENPYPLFNDASAFCLTSIWEGMPVVIMESMILKCPVISVDCPSGPTEMISNKKNGLLVNRNKKDLADGILYILNNPLLVKEWKKAAYTKAKEWDIKNYIDSFNKII
jgi:glycosyltransferase involved in cell wall biosynthesis